MICYLDSSALVKRYVLEPGSEEDWPDLVRIQISEFLIGIAAGYARKHGLRGFDAVQLAAAAIWQDNLENPITLLTFDRQLWAAARREGMNVRPETL